MSEDRSLKRAHAPVAEGVDVVGRQPSEHHFVGRVPVCLYPIDQRARARAHRTGFSRSGNPDRWSGSEMSQKRHFGGVISPLDWVLRLVYLDGTVYVRSDALSIAASARAEVTTTSGPFCALR